MIMKFETGDLLTHRYPRLDKYGKILKVVLLLIVDTDSLNRKYKLLWIVNELAPDIVGKIEWLYYKLIEKYFMKEERYESEI